MVCGGRIPSLKQIIFECAFFHNRYDARTAVTALITIYV